MRSFLFFMAVVLAFACSFSVALQQAEAKTVTKTGVCTYHGHEYGRSNFGSYAYKRTLAKSKLSFKLEKTGYFAGGRTYTVPEALRSPMFKLSKKVKFYTKNIYTNKSKKISYKKAKKLLKSFNVWSVDVTVKKKKVTKIELCYDH